MTYPLNNESERTGPLAGARRQQQSTLVVDYADVLRQAVANERDRLLYEIHREISAIETAELKPRSTWDSQPKDPKRIRAEALRIVERHQ